MSKHTESPLFMTKVKNFVKGNAFLLGFLVIILLIGGFMILENKKENKEQIYGDDVIDMYYFHLSTCPHCAKQNEFNKKLVAKYPNLRINSYEITKEESKQKYVEFTKIFPEEVLSKTNIATPTTIIGSKVNVGYGDDLTTGAKIEQMILEEQKRIDANWNNATMKRTIDLRTEALNNE